MLQILDNFGFHHNVCVITGSLYWFLWTYRSVSVPISYNIILIKKAMFKLSRI